MSTSSALTYTSYLRLNELLNLQTPRSQPVEHDETLFIMIHQIYELWFKQILHELGFLGDAFDANDASLVLHTLKRILTILKTLVAQIDVLETMTPISFSSFRLRLENASGFQSLQFRLLEFTLGKRDLRVLQNYADSPQAAERLKLLTQSPSIYDHFLAYLKRQQWPIPDSIIARDYAAALPESADVREVFISIYRKDPFCASLCERLVDLDEGLQEWRYRHVKMVERTIGFKTGTGGSAGAEYLRTTLFRPLFADLWAIRGQL